MEEEVMSKVSAPLFKRRSKSTIRMIGNKKKAYVAWQDNEESLSSNEEQ